MNEPKTREDETQPSAVLEETADSLTASLTVLFARTQLLEREIRHGKVRDATECLHALEAITRVEQDLKKELLRLHAIIRTHRRARAGDLNRGIGSHDTWARDGSDDMRLL